LTAPPFEPRQFVWCRFPFFEDPLRPGPQEHIAYIVDLREIREHAHLTVMSLYTTTRPWQPGVKLPLGVLPVEPALARTMKQKAFVIDARKIAFLPLTPDFFPRLDRPDKGIVHTASERFHTLVRNILMELAKRPDLVVPLGPDAPHRRRVRKPPGKR
jgi:hypothetical protein